MYNMAIIVDNIELYNWNLLRELNLNVLNKKKKINIWDNG